MVNLPELENKNLWCGWKTIDRGSGPTKIPFKSLTGGSGGAKANDPSTWSTLEEARNWIEKNNGDGVGIFFAPIGEGLNLCGIDLDLCRNTTTGELTPWALEVISKVNSYCEISPSKTGVKIFYLLSDEDLSFVKSHIGTGNSKMFAGDITKHAPAIECHFSGRYFTVTGISLREEDRNYDLKVISRENLLHVLDVTGPELAKTCPEHPAYEGTPGSSNLSRRSGRAFVRMLAMAKMGMTEDEIRSAIATDPDVGIREWLFEKVGASEREWDRSWEKIEDILQEKKENDAKLAAALAETESVASVRAARRATTETATKEELFQIPFTAWPDPKPLPEGLRPVLPFDIDYLPEAIGPWVADIAERMQCPTDFVGIAAMTALGTVIGTSVCIHPYQKDDWSEVANLWSCIIGRPGVLKSPAVQEALKPLDRLEAKAREQNKEDLKNYAVEMHIHKIRKEAEETALKKALKDGITPDYNALRNIEEPERPQPKKYIVQDSTYEKVGVNLASNEKGIMVHCDELVSFFKKLDDDSHAADRNFYMKCWSGLQSYEFDRISRGMTFIPTACISLLGTTQPGSISEYVQRAVKGGNGDDGFIQRFGLFVWPDPSKEWKKVDRHPDSEARRQAHDTFIRLDKITGDAVGATPKGEHVKIPYLCFDAEAQDIFDEWRAKLEKEIRSEELTPALEAHKAKYRGLIPSLALINHLADVGHGPVGADALVRALSFSEYLESHMLRIYGVASDFGVSAARTILKKIKAAYIQDNFTAKDVYIKHWAGLSRETVQSGLDTLIDFGWLWQTVKNTGGRPTQAYAIHPVALGEKV